MRIENVEQMEVWKQAHELVLRIYSVTRKFPDTERFGLVVQMRRAAVSVPANIAEGFKRRGVKDKARFYNMAHGSLEELRYYLRLCFDLGYLADSRELSRSAENIGRMLTGLTRATYRRI